MQAVGASFEEILGNKTTSIPVIPWQFAAQLYYKGMTTTSAPEIRSAI